MKKEIENKCKTIIHTHAVAAAVGNAVPVPGVGAATDIVTMTSMAMQLAAVFGSSIPENVAKGLAITALKRQILKQPIKSIASKLGKYIPVPVVGSTLSASLSVAMLESAGWSMAKQMEVEAERVYAGR